MYMMSVSPFGACPEQSAILGLAILNYAIIEWEARVIIMMFFITVAVESTAVMSTMLQEVLKEVLLEGLTTMLLPCTSVQGKYIIAQLFEFRNSTPSQRVPNAEGFTFRSHLHLRIRQSYHPQSSSFRRLQSFLLPGDLLLHLLDEHPQLLLALLFRTSIHISTDPLACRISG